MSGLTDIEKKKLMEEYDHLGLLVTEYFNRIKGLARLYNFERADYYLEESRKCIARRDAILQTLYGHGTGFAK